MPDDATPFGFVQASPTASMTISSGQAGVFPTTFGYYPAEGSRAVSAQYDWTTVAAYAEDLSQLVARGVETTIQGVYIDNSTVSEYVTLTVAGTGQVLVVQPYCQGLFPLFFTGTPSFTLTVAAPTPAVTRLTLLNVPPQTVGLWAGAPGGGALVGPFLSLSGGNVTGPVTFGPGNVTMTAPLLWTATGGSALRAAQDRSGQVIDIRDLGAACDGVTDDTPAWTLAFAKPNGTVIRVPQNCVSMVAGNAALSAGNHAISIIGDGPSSVIRVSSAITARLFSWNGASGVRVENLTVDLNSVAAPAALIDGILYMQIGSGLSVRNVRIINSPLNLYLICFHNVSDFTVERCFLQVITGSSTVQSKGIACESSLGPNTNGRIVENTLVNTNTNFTGSNQMYIAGNDISGWGVGAGISNGGPAVGTATNRIIIGNRCHDSLPAIDMFGDVTSGLEEWSITAIIANNLCWNCGGYGILFGGDNSGSLSSSLIIGNQCWDNYRIAAGSVTAGGIVLATGASGTCIVDNHCWDSGAGTQPYGFNIANTGITNLTLAGNIFRGTLGDVSRLGVATFQNNIEYTPRLLSADPTVPLGAATKQYVDSHRGILLYQTTALVGNGADTTIDLLQSFSIPGGTLVNVGDRIAVKAGGGYIGSTDGKTISVTWGGGGSILNVTGSTAAAIGWRLEGEFIKTASGVQTASLSGVTNAAAVAVNTSSLTRTDTAAIIVAINGQNGTNPTPNSLTCRYFTVDYVPAS